MKCSLLAVFVALLSFGIRPAIAQNAAPAPTLMNFQGRLAKQDGTPLANGTYAVRFSLWDNAATPPGVEKWNQTQNVTVRNGTFAVLLGSGTSFPPTLFNGNVWLKMKIGNDAALTPRQQIVSVAFALKANSVADGSITNASIASGAITADRLAANALNPLAWLLGGNNGTNPASNFLGTTDNQPFSVRVNNLRALRISYGAGSGFHTFNLLGGADSNSIAAGVFGATIAGGGYAGNTDLPNVVNSNYGFLGGGYYNTINTTAADGVIGGGFQNTINTGANDAAVVGGINNTAGFPYSFIGGGQNNSTGGANAFVGGGSGNSASGMNAVVAGGSSNTANSSAVVGGGETNTASGTDSSVGGGFHNTASSGAATVAGGNSNMSLSTYATVGGGHQNKASGDTSTIGGGESNAASVAYTTIGGGKGNFASNNYAAVGGGFDNHAIGLYSFVGGGESNGASTDNCVVAGGQNNLADELYATVGGGLNNIAAGIASTVAGGQYNVAAGTFSFAAGSHAQANHAGAFVWADSQNGSFASSASNQFCIRAAGGVCINTNAPAGAALRVQCNLNTVGIAAGDIAPFGAASFESNRSTSSFSHIYCANNGTGVFYVLGSGQVVANGYFTTSDLRYKHNIATFPHALDTLLNLRGVTFDWKREEYKNVGLPEGGQIGFIAQEVEKILPQLVNTDQAGRKSVNYVGVVPVAVEAIRTLNGKMDALQAENVELKAQIAALAAAVKKLQEAKK